MDGNGGDGGGGGVLDREGEIIAIAAQIEIGITPGVELGGSTQGLSGAHAGGALFGMMDDDHGDAVAALQLAQIGEQRRHLAAGVLIDAMQPYEGIEGAEPRFAFAGECLERPPGGLERQQAHRRRPVAVLVSAGGGEHVSRNSFSSICRASRSAAYTSSSPAMFMRARRLPWA